MFHTFLFFVLFAVASSYSNSVFADISKDRVQGVILKAQENILNRQTRDHYWNFSPYLGTHFISQYYLFLKWLNRSDTLLDEKKLMTILLKTQLPDGSWYAVPDKNIQEGDLDATIYNYWALKVMGLSVEDPVLKKARKFILKKGGIDKSALFVKIVLALFNNFSWKEIPRIPLFIFSEKLVDHIQPFAQWVDPHLFAIAYLRDMSVNKKLGDAFSLQELSVKKKKIRNVQRKRVSRAKKEILKRFITTLLRKQQPRGSWGGYSLSTMLTIFVLDHYTKIHTGIKRRADRSMRRGFRFVETLYFKSGESSYLGVLDDGRYWDTALSALALMESGYSRKSLLPVGKYLAYVQQDCGGFPYGEDFWYAPDTDDTSEIILLLNHLDGFKKEVKHAVLWLTEMQNRDGGWGAFYKDNNEIKILEYLFDEFMDSADLFDESSPDITGHVLEALADTGLNRYNSRAVRRGIRYLKKSQDSATGAWYGRWGINYIYGTGAALVGLIRVGENTSSPYMQKAIKWLLSRQNKDGGFGETSRSYTDIQFAGVGISTPSQTAWAILPLIEAGMARHIQTQKAISYLLDSFEEHGRWIDSSVVGTGHPGVLYMNYPAYPYTFPLIALGRYQEKQ